MSQGMGMNMGGGSMMQMLMPLMGMLGGAGGGGQGAEGQQGIDPALLGMLAGQMGGGDGAAAAPAAAPGIAPSMAGAGAQSMAPGMMPSAATAAPGATQQAGMSAPGMMPSATAGGAPQAPGMMPSSGQTGEGAAGVQAPPGTAAPAGGLGGAEPSTLDKFLGIFSGGHDKSPEGQDTFRKYNALMSAGTALGGAIAGPGTMVGDVSKELNRFAQGNIAASNVEQQQRGINDMAKSALGALGGQGQSSGANTKLSGAGGAKTGAFNQPISAPQGGGGAFGGISPATAQTLSLDDLDKQLASLNIAF